MRESRITIISLMAIAGGVWLYRKLKASADSLAEAKRRADDVLVDAMSEQSFPASDAPAY